MSASKHVTWDESVVGTQLDDENQSVGSIDAIQLTQGMSEQDSLKVQFEKDPASLDCPVLVVRQCDENGNEVLSPRHFFVDDKMEVKVGSGHRRDTDCDVILPDSHLIGFSDVAFTVSWCKNSSSLVMDRAGRGSLMLQRSKSTTVETIPPDAACIALHDGDELFSAKTDDAVKLKGIRFHVPEVVFRGERDGDDNGDKRLKLARERATIEVQEEIRMHEAAIAKLRLKQQEISLVPTLDALRTLVGTRLDTSMPNELVGAKRSRESAGNMGESLQPKR